MLIQTPRPDPSPDRSDIDHLAIVALMRPYSREGESAILELVARLKAAEARIAASSEKELS